MRVLHVHTRYRNPGGEDAVVDAERSLLARSGVDLHTLDFKNPTSSVDSIVGLAQAPWNRSASAEVVEQARRLRADVVHIHNTWFALSPAVVPALHQAGFPVVMTFHNYRLVCVNAMLYRDGRPCEMCVGRSTLPGVRYRCYRGSFAQSAIVSATVHLHRARRTWSDGLTTAIALTGFARDRLIQGGLRADRTVVKPNFVVDPGPRTDKPSASNRVLFVGRLAPEKGIRSLLQAWGGARLPGLELVVAGDGPEASSLRGSTLPGVRFVGFLEADEVRSLMLASRAIAVPSMSYEGMPMVILEALASGLPVFHTAMGALIETTGEGGIAIGDGDVGTMVDGLRSLADDDEMDRVGHMARLAFERDYTEAKSIAALHDIYAEAIA